MAVSFANGAVASFGALNGYWGQLGDDRLSSYCDTGIEYVTLSFVNQAPENTESGYPGTNFAGHCWAGNYLNEDGIESDLLSECYWMKQDISYCKSKNVKVLLSIGGEYNEDTSNYKVTTKENGQEFATFLYKAFGPFDPTWTGPRPFDFSADVHTSVDGFDFDIEADFDNAPYIAMADTFRALDSSMILAAAPQCPTNEHFHLKDLIQKADLDLLFIQFYNNPYCDAIKSTAAGDGFNYKSWIDVLKKSDKNKDAKIFIGLPSAPDAAGSGYISPSALKTLVCEWKGAANFGGVSLWDLTRGALTPVSGKSYQQHAQEILRGSCPSTTTTTKATSTVKPTTTTKKPITTAKLTTTTKKPTTTAKPTTTTKKSTTTTKKPTTTAKPTTTTKKPTTTAKPTTTTKKPTTTAKPTTTTKKSTTTTKKPTTTAKPATTTKKPTTTAKPATTTKKVTTTTKKPTTTAKPVTTTKKPTTTAKPATTTKKDTATTKKPTTTAKPVTISKKVTTTTKKPTTTAKPATTMKKPTTTAKPATTTKKSTTTAKPATTTVKPSTTSKPSTTTKPTTTTKPATTAKASTTTIPASSKRSIASASGSSSTETSTTAETTSSFSTWVPPSGGWNSTSTATASDDSLDSPSATDDGSDIGVTTTSAVSYTTSTAYTTLVHTVTKCPPSVVDCPAGGYVTTETIPIYTTVCPVTETDGEEPPYPTATSVVDQPPRGPDGPGAPGAPSAPEVSNEEPTGPANNVNEGSSGSGCFGPACPHDEPVIPVGVVPGADVGESEGEGEGEDSHNVEATETHYATLPIANHEADETATYLTEGPVPTGAIPTGGLTITSSGSAPTFTLPVEAGASSLFVGLSTLAAALAVQFFVL